MLPTTADNAWQNNHDMWSYYVSYDKNVTHILQCRICIYSSLVYLIKKIRSIWNDIVTTYHNIDRNNFFIQTIREYP